MFTFYIIAICLFKRITKPVLSFVFVWWEMLFASRQKTLTDNPESKSPGVSQAQLPDELLKKIKKGEEGYQRRETCVALNLLLQFFFQEIQYENSIMRWLTNMLTLEFNELLKHKALSKIIGSMQIRDLKLGDNFPIIKAVTPQHVDLDSSTSTLDLVEVALELEYNGGIQLAVDASSRFAKSTTVTIKVVSLSGKARLQFSRYPFSHWSFSFYEEPEVKFEVKSNLLGRHIPRFANIIVSQLRSMLKRKHTLPYYKLRAIPLIKRHLSASAEEGCSVPPGRLTVQIVKCSRLQKCIVGEFLYCTIILSEVPLVCGIETTAGLWLVQDLLIKRPKGSPIGILLRNSEDKEQIVETVAVGSSAYIGGVRKGDILQSVNNTLLTSGTQAAKLFSANSSVTDEEDHATISARIKRFIPHSDSTKISIQSSKSLDVDGVQGIVDEDITGIKRSDVGLVVCSSLASTSSSSTIVDKTCTSSIRTPVTGSNSSTSTTNSSTGQQDQHHFGSTLLSNYSTTDSLTIRSNNFDSDCNAVDVPVLSNLDDNRLCSDGAIGDGGDSGGGGITISTCNISSKSNKFVRNNSSCIAESVGSSDDRILSMVTGSSFFEDNVPRLSSSMSPARAVSPSHLLTGITGIMGGLHGSNRPKRHHSSLPGSPILQRTTRNRNKSSHYGEGSLSRSSTPDSSHNNSPELKRKNLNIKSTHDESPTLSSSTNNTSSNLPENPDKLQDGQYSTAGTPTSSEMNNQHEAVFSPSPSHRTEERHSSSSRRRNKQLTLKLGHTGIVTGTTDPIFGTNLEFWLNEENKYLHVAVWSQKSKLPDECNETKSSSEEIASKENESSKKKSKDYEKKDKQMDDNRNESKYASYLTKSITEDTFVGYTNISLISLIPETSLNTQGHIVKVLTLSPPDPTCPEVGSHPLQSHKGFDPSLCYGDITLSLVYQPQDRVEGTGADRFTSNIIVASEDEASLTDGTASEEDNDNSSDQQNQQSHTFKRTHFHSATYCDFCKKKIWLKFAYQCNTCSIICHKKCMAKCNNETLCDMGGICFKDYGKSNDVPGTTFGDSNTASPPDIVTCLVTTGASDDEENTQDQSITASPQNQKRRTLGSLLAQVASAGKGSIKRAGSASNLSLPNQLLEASLSRSLPQTPQHTPQTSRRGSLSDANPFEMDYDREEETEEVLDRLLLYQHDERLLSLARDSAKDLYKQLQSEQRRAKISSMLEQVKANVDHEGEIRVDLAHQEKKATDTGDDLARTKVSLQISKCDARTQALALLTLHYCTALQFCSDPPQVIFFCNVIYL
ncbi:unnamed protein product [Meganyctiphanes norvegica]|uniref:PDZ domain-containing protein 8 n=1 Tax=Meganyctiphanes norvegica TaxID=48144 RepID=A0AAV2Q1B5_MEGNR